MPRESEGDDVVVADQRPAGRRRRAARSCRSRGWCGTRRRSAGTAPVERSVAAWATSAKSCASCTELAHSIAQPVVRACITSLWSPKIDSACVATVRAATWITAGRQLAGDLEHVRDHQQQALRGRERRRQRALLERAVQRAGGAGLGLHLDHVGHRAPQVRSAGRGPVVGVLAHRRRRGDRVDRDHLAQRVGHPGRGLVAVDARPHLGHRSATFANWCRASTARHTVGQLSHTRRRDGPVGAGSRASTAGDR